MSLPSEAGQVHILRGVSLDIPEGQSVGIVGPSGSGKSTLMAVMTGLDKATDGRVHVAGQDITDLDEDSLALFRRENVGIVLQAFRLIPTMTALENVAVPLELAGRKGAFERAEAELKAVGLGHRLSHYPAQLSGGEQQMLSIARALCRDIKVLLLDEPYEGLAPVIVDEIEKTLIKIKELGITTIIVEQNAIRALELADRAVILDTGSVVFDGTANEVLENEELRAEYLAV